jgi:hypothetical protein
VRSCPTASDCALNEQSRIVFFDAVSAGGITTPIDLAYEVGQDLIGAAGIEKKQLPEVDRGDPADQHLQQASWGSFVDEIARNECLDDDVSEPPR